VGDLTRDRVVVDWRRGDLVLLGEPIDEVELSGERATRATWPRSLGDSRADLFAALGVVC
jgi:hypothetical protein